MVQKLITSVTLRECFPPNFFNRGMITTTHIVFFHETLVEDRPSEDEESALGVESSKTKENDKVVANL